MEGVSARNTAKVVDFGDDRHNTRNSVDQQGVDVEAQKASNASSRRGRQSISQLMSPYDGRHDESATPTDSRVHRVDTGASLASAKSLRRRGRAGTHVAYGGEDMGAATGWAPGLEPGIDTSDPPPYTTADDENREIRHLEQLHQQCEIMVVDYSPEQMNSQFLDNQNLKDFLAEEQEDWSQVRWINVNGLSWDVIKELGKYKCLHRLAIEDLLNTRNRTKADWYNDHTYVVLPLQKLVNVEDEDDSSSEEEDEYEDDKDRDYDKYNSRNGSLDKVQSRTRVERERKRRKHALQHQQKRGGAIRSWIKDFMQPKKKKKKRSMPARMGHLTKSTTFKQTSGVTAPWVPKKVRTLQQYHAGPNEDRIEFMQRHSTLGKRGLGVSMEQVSIFLTADNTVISFFEYSAQDVEVPIMRRLQSQNTILRQSCDASMLVQSILDTIIDLAIPVTTAYQDAIGDLELAVLTDPDIQESTSLYILTSEIAVLRNAIAPVNQLIGSLKEHKATATALTVPSRAMTPAPTGPNERPPMLQFPRTQRLEVISTGVSISELTKTYLSDVEDHVSIIQDAYDQMRRNADNLVDLIFNVVSSYQNEAMKQLTIVSAFFLPLTFLTGYFGMNFEVFPGVQKHSDKFFWSIAVPVCAVVLIILLREWIVRWVTKLANKSLIKRGRKRRLATAGD